MKPGIKHLKCSLTLFFLVIYGLVNAQNKPFPQGVNFPGCIKPSNVTQAQMNTAIQTFYNTYKSKYLKQCPDKTDQYYMYAEGNPSSSTDATVSEQHGYAMITMALMAGYDANAKKYYDGMYKLYSRFRSPTNNNFMSWKIKKNGSTMSGGEGSATDGDFDIAYSLILAHYQWGGGPEGTTVTYLNEAKRMINAFKGTNGVVGSSTYRTLLGDDFSNQLNTRSSDWMIDHMTAYKNATGDAFWTNVENEVYNCITDLTGTGKPGASTGLVADFAKNDPAVPDAAGGGTGEDAADKYSWNGCRYPWRIAMGYQHYSSTKAKSAITKLLDWATGTPTSGDPKNFNGGYNLNGTKLGDDAGELAFVAPITLAATVDAKYQSFLNKGWGELTTLSGGDSYNDAIGLLCMLSISGNWWVPGSTSTPTAPTAPSALLATAVSSSQINLSWTDNSSNEDNFKIEYSTNGGTSWTALATTAANTSSYSNTGLTAATAYSYRVYAVNTTGNSAYSNAVTATTQPVGTSANLALNKTGAASSLESSTYPATLAFDGNATTRWASVEAVDPQWIYVDLGATYAVNRVKITWEAAYAKNYLIQVSTDAATWTTINTVTGNTALVNDYTALSGSGRYVRIYGTARGTAYGYSIYELEVYGAVAPTTSNIAINKTASASSVEEAGFEASKAFDGDATATRWSSSFADNQWLAADLGTAQNISRVVLKWEAAYATSYRIETSSDNVTWTTQKTVTAGAGGTEDLSFPAVSARYVRMYGLTRATEYGYSIWEFEVYTAPLSAAKLSLSPVLNENPVSVTISPNPAKDVLTVKYKGTSSQSVLRIYNMTGQQTYFSKVSGNMTQIDVSKWPKGIYIVSLNSIRKKIVIE
jgi:endo-1,4-beta-D-glucanase Y